MATTKKKTTTRKTASTKAKSTPKADPADNSPVPAEVSATEVTALRKADLLAAVVTRSGVKKRDAKPVVEAMLAVLGETLAEGRGLNLPPFGKAKIAKTKEMGAGRMIVTRIRQKDRPTLPAKDPLAEAAE